MRSKSLTTPTVANAVKTEQLQLQRRLEAIVARYAAQSYDEMLALDHLCEDGLERRSELVTANLESGQ